ncbi:MAG: hypothetical protein EOP54_17125 [Sphingobacteriales bacterium]|nr:MAG: hypothetical protein EOP54_17125 [Sphingobacteriales bacterium]
MKPNYKIKAVLLVITALIAACQPEKSEVNNGLTDPNLDASFTLAEVSGKMNTYLVRSNTQGVIGVKWNKGDGSGFVSGKLLDTIVYEDAGNYTLTSEVIGRGGLRATSSKQVAIASSVPIENNLLQGANMDAGDEAFWQPIAYTPGVTFSIASGKMVATGGSFGQAGIYQTVQLVAGKKYKIDMNVSGSGATDTWFEVYLGTAAPGAGDYNSGGNRMGLNTWTGCGGSAFSGKLSTLSCVGSGSVVTATATGTAYLVIRSGGANLGSTGISVDRVSLIEVQ